MTTAFNVHVIIVNSPQGGVPFAGRDDKEVEREVLAYCRDNWQSMSELDFPDSYEDLYELQWDGDEDWAIDEYDFTIQVDQPFEVEVELDGVYLSDSYGEIVSWSIEEWEDDPRTALSVFELIKMGYEKGAKAVREAVGNRHPLDYQNEQ